MILDGKIKDMEFAKLVLQVDWIDRKDLFSLQRISEWMNMIWLSLNKEYAESLERKWFIELYGRSPKRRARVSFKLLDEIDMPEQYVLGKWIWTKRRKHLILEFLEKRWEIKTSDVYKLFPKANKNSLRVLLKVMHDDDQSIKRLKTWVYEKV